MRIVIDTIPHDRQRYSTVGDWTFDKEFYCLTCTHSEPPGPDSEPECPRCHRKMPSREVLNIRVSQLSDWRREMLVGVHELVEVIQCKHAGVTQEVVDKFDKDFEAHRHPDNEDEPGDEPLAPYVSQHCFATGIERILAACLDVKWKHYEAELMALPEIKPK